MTSEGHEAFRASPANKSTFAMVLLLEAAIIAALWLLGSMFS